jgi:hypothetical protein
MQNHCCIDFSVERVESTQFNLNKFLANILTNNVVHDRLLRNLIHYLSLGMTMRKLLGRS